MIELGGNIQLVGFKELDYAEFVVVKKVVGNYARKFSQFQDFSGLKLALKPIHKTQDEISKFEIKGSLDLNGSHIHADIVEHNLFIGLDKVLKKLEAQMS